MRFQTELREEALRLLGSEAMATEIANLERDIRVTFGAYELWIYEDGANIVGPSTDKRFEIYDFDDLDCLKEFGTCLLSHPARQK